MGIPGLTTYVADRADYYLRHYELHDCYLVIDGNSVGCQIYSLYSNTQCAFGGDYDRYYQCVFDFFDKLLKCNVTPLVLLDGGSEDKKLNTVIKRLNDRLQLASHLLPARKRGIQFTPLFRKEVFYDAAREKGIKCVQCLFEADNAIASAAKILGCPVLSYDSDFYIYGTKYIPFNTLDNYVVKSSSGNGYAMRCRIYEVEYLLRSFKGLDQSLLPLAATLLGNDYVNRSVFKDFFQHMKLPHAKNKEHNTGQERIEATLSWLSRYALDEAIGRILCRLPKQYRKEVLDVIESNVNSYTNMSPDILLPLGFSTEYVARLSKYSVNRVFKFNGDTNNLSDIEETTEVNGCSNNFLMQNLPGWFIDEFTTSKLPSYFMDLLVRSLYICPILIEDCHYPSSNVASLRIIGMIYQLLISGLSGTPRQLNYLIREEMRITRRKLDADDCTFSCRLPSLRNLRDIPLTDRHAILNETLGITDTGCINELLPEWMLYIATAKYWVDQQQYEALRSHCYVYSLWFCMLFSFVDDKVGKYKDVHRFQAKNGEKIALLEQKRKAMDHQPQYSTNVSLAEAVNEIDPDDCLLAATFFLSHSEIDPKLHDNPKKFNITVVHAFSEFQSCLRHSMNLNALLGCPYEQTKVGKLFNGTMLYNVYNIFKSHNNVELYISNVLRNSPSLLRLFNVLLAKVKPLFASVMPGKCGERKRRKIKSKSTKPVEEDDIEMSEITEAVCDTSFYDANNRFTFLNSAAI